MSAPYFADDLVTLHLGDCRGVMAAMEDASADSVVTDPPYELAFMGRSWDASGIAYDVGVWRECLRVLKPGGHLLAFGGTRTYHRMACAIEDAGFEIRDSLHWLYGSGFPKSLDVSKAIDKRRDDTADTDKARAWLDAERRRAGFTLSQINEHFGHASNGGGSASSWTTNPTSRALPTWEQWQKLRDLIGFGDEMDAEVWRLNGRKGKPGDAFADREILETRQVGDIRNGHGRKYGSALFAGEATGMIEHHVTASATDAAKRWEGWGTALKPAHEPIAVARKPMAGTVAQNVLTYGTGAMNIDGSVNDAGRWPPNVLLGPAAAAELDRQGVASASRIFPVFRYQAKASGKERPRLPDGTAWPTVKPLDLMRWLVRLVTPPGGLVLDPFAGSGTTGQACALEGFRCVLIDQDPVAAELARVRLSKPVQPALIGGAA